MNFKCYTYQTYFLHYMNFMTDFSKMNLFFLDLNKLRIIIKLIIVFKKIAEKLF